ncbi:MAG: NAD(P)H-quinone oxidoreductase [Pseudomonadota bacterium]
MTQTMRVAEISTPGGPEVLVAGTRPVPEPGPDEVLIRVAAAGVNRPDCLQRAGLYPAPPGASDLPGLEVAGEVAAAGSNVTRWRPGDIVCALTHGGGYAEYVRVHAGSCVPVPERLTPAQAAALPETTFTVYFNVWMRAGLQPGDSLLIHGGSSGIGTTAIQFAKALGHDVIVTAGSEEKCTFCRELGADLAINYRDGDWRGTLAEARPDGVDVVLDMVAGPYTQQNIDALRADGRYALIALVGGAIADGVSMASVLRKRLTITGSTLRPQPDAVKAEIATNLERDLWPLVSAGSMTPVIHAEFPLAQAAEAHALMERGEHMGKIVLTVD